MCVRRKAVCVAFAFVCSLLYASAAWGVYQKEFVSQQDFAAGAADGLRFLNELSGITLSESTCIVPAVWAPSPVDGMVSKINSRVGKEIARYKIGPANEHWAPCSVATDTSGNAYIACSAHNQAGKIVRIVPKGGVDRNKDGIIATSGDFDSNDTITPTEVLPWGVDERVAYICEVGPEGTTPSAIINDGKGYLWVALREECAVVKIDAISGVVVATVPVVGMPSNLVFGRNDSLWVLSSQNNALTEVNTAMNNIVSTSNLDFPCGSIVMDSNAKLWMGNNNGGLVCLDTKTSKWSTYTADARYGVAGLAIDHNGDVWGACPAFRSVARFSGANGSLVATVQLGKSASSVAVDTDGYLWALCDSDIGAFKVDTRSDKLQMVAQTAAMPYCSTPFTSCYSIKGYLAEGYWQTVLDAGFAGAGWGRISWSSIEAGGRIKMEARVADTPEALVDQKFKPVGNNVVFEGPNGRYCQVRAILEGPGNTSPILYGMRVEGINLAPDISKAKVNMPRISRTDHVMEQISIMDVKDPEGDPFKVVITGVMQDEAVSGLGEGDKAPDAILTGSQSVWLRGECAPATKDKSARGRIYQVAFKATDAYGAVSTGKIKVIVVPSIEQKDVVVAEGGKKYDSTKEIYQNVAKAE